MTSIPLPCDFEVKTPGGLWQQSLWSQGTARDDVVFQDMTSICRDT